MDHSSKLIAALVLSFAGTAHAGYAQAAPPSGWSPGSYAVSANDASYGRVIYAPNGPTTNVGGQAVKMPAAYRLAANAPRIAASLIFANPYLRAGIGIATWLGVSKIVWDEVEKVWKEFSDTQTFPGGYLYRVEILPASYTSWHTTKESACYEGFDYKNSFKTPGHAYNVYTFTNVTGLKCNGNRAFYSSTGAFQFNEPDGFSLVSKVATGNVCPQGWTLSPAGCLSPALQQPNFVDKLNPANQPGWPMPSTVPFELPQPTPLPIEQPSPWINPSPGPNPEHQPRFVPSGDPVPNPNYDPNAAPGPNNQPYIQPGTRVVPSPTPSQPWRVDHQPVNRPQDDATPKPNPDAEPGTDPADKPKPEEQQSLCEKHPDIVACAKLGEPGQATPVPNETKTLTIAPENGFGPSGASCPPPRTVQVAGLTLSMPFDLLCDFATGLKPVIVGLAWLSAAFAFMGIGRRS